MFEILKTLESSIYYSKFDFFLNCFEIRDDFCIWIQLLRKEQNKKNEIVY